LVKGLVQSFTSESKNVQAGTVSEETELFEPGILNTGDGSSVTTYKDILNLATEVGDPSLVYKFMSLAGHSALWASRRGAAFGLGSILSKANLDEIFESNNRLSKSLIPKLFRYRFDPNSSVQQSMRDIWDVLIKDKSAAINDNFYDILEELLVGMGNREWRVRQASCAAMQDLLQGRPIEKYQARLEEIWRMSFRVVDDIKESVRNAAMQLCRGLTTSLVRHVDVSSGASEKRAKEILEKLIPFLTGNYGLQSDAEEVQTFALNTLLQLCKKAGKALKPYIPSLGGEFIELLSTLEPQSMNYLSLNADKYGITREDVDASRMASLRGSPMMDAVEQMVELVDDDLMSDFITSIVKAVKRSVGLPSKLAASRVLVSLTVRKLQETTPYADKLLLAAKSQLTSNNETVSQSYAISAGYICRMASHKQVLEYAEYLQRLFFESEDENPRRVSAVAVSAVAKHSGDKFDSLSSAFLPFIFIATHDIDSGVREKFEQTWNDNTGGTGAIKLHIREIIDIVQQHLASRQWSVRQVSAKSIAEACNRIGDDASVIKNLDALYDVLFEACSGRSWKGKEVVFDALVSLAVRTKSTVLENSDLFSKLNKAVTVEVKRKNKEYQREAIPSFARYLKEFPQPELYTTLFEVADIYLTSTGEQENEEDGDGDTTMNNNSVNSLGTVRKEEDRNKVLKGVLASFNPRDLNNKPLPDSIFKKLVSYISGLFSEADVSSIPLTWKTKLTVINGSISLCESFETTTEAESYAEDLMKLWKLILDNCAKDFNHERIRTDSAKGAKSFLSILSNAQKNVILDDLKKLRSEEKSTVVQAELNRVINL
jgi:proteasome component ECM29